MNNIHLSDCIWQNYFTSVEDLSIGKDCVERKIVMQMIVLAEEHIFKYVFKHICKLAFHEIPLLMLLRMSCSVLPPVCFRKRDYRLKRLRHSRMRLDFDFPSSSSLPFSLLKVWRQYSLAKGKFELKSTK